MKIFWSVWWGLNTWKCKHELATIKCKNKWVEETPCIIERVVVHDVLFLSSPEWNSQFSTKKMQAQIITNHPKIRWLGRRKKKKATTIAHIRTYQPPLRNLSIKSQIWVLNHKQSTDLSIKPPNQHKPNQIHSNIHPKIQIIKPTKKKTKNR